MEEKAKILIFTALLVMLASLWSCNQSSLSFLSRTYPHQEYRDKLQKQGLVNTGMGARWIESAEQSLVSSVESKVPFAVKGFFRAEQAEALSWRFPLSRGSTVDISVDWRSQDSTKLFIDLFYRNGETWEHAASSKEGTFSLAYESEKNTDYLVRLQPELLARGQFELRVEQRPTYTVFPVRGKDSRAVWSVFGDPRDGGRRSHEGIDIFAARGTPVLSPVKGIVSSVRNGGLGGKSIFIRDSKRGHNLYFAHLDSQLVRTGSRVNIGDTLGLVGNTGNARHTSPHLHFGIYAGFSGAIDPLPFVKDLFDNAEPVTASIYEGRILVVNAPKANFRSGPGTAFSIYKSLEKDDVVYVKAGNNDWYLVETPDHIFGYIHRSLAGVPASEEIADEDGQVYGFWDPFANLQDSIVVSKESLESIGKFQSFNLVRHQESNITFWTRKG